MADIQQSMFPDHAPDYELEPEDQPADRSVPLRPGWALMQRRGRRNPIWHRIVSKTGNGTLVAACGVHGWNIEHDSDTMRPCEKCLDKEPKL